jgi:ribosomal protein S18 acetylase RimI-like enzyme
MPDLIYRLAQRADYRPLAEWLIQISQTPQQHCLHTWSGQSARELHQQLTQYWDDSELCYVLAHRSGALVAAMGSEYDESLGRAWLHGPHVALADWAPVAGRLYDRLLAELPASIAQFDAYLNIDNLRGRRFYARHGFTEREHRNYDFALAEGDRVASGDTGCQLLAPEHEPSFRQLYGVLFPTAYYSAGRIIQMIGHTHQVFVIADRDQVLGFAVVNDEGPASEAEIQFVGVRQDSRRQGYARRLLLAATDWLFDTAQASQISLNVAEERVHARALYESVGFHLRYTGIGLTKTCPDGTGRK